MTYGGLSNVQLSTASGVGLTQQQRDGLDLVFYMPGYDKDGNHLIDQDELDEFLQRKAAVDSGNCREISETAGRKLNLREVVSMMAPYVRLQRRLGVASMFNPFQPDGEYILDLGREDEFMVASMLLILSAERGHNTRYCKLGNSHCDLAGEAFMSSFLDRKFTGAFSCYRITPPGSASAAMRSRIARKQLMPGKHRWEHSIHRSLLDTQESAEHIEAASMKDFDEDRFALEADGTLVEKEHLAQLERMWPTQLQLERIRAAFKSADTNDDGVIDAKEFKAMLVAKSFAQGKGKRRARLNSVGSGLKTGSLLSGEELDAANLRDAAKLGESASMAQIPLGLDLDDEAQHESEAKRALQEGRTVNRVRVDSTTVEFQVQPEAEVVEDPAEGDARARRRDVPGSDQQGTGTTIDLKTHLEPPAGEGEEDEEEEAAEEVGSYPATVDKVILDGDGKPILGCDAEGNAVGRVVMIGDEAIDISALPKADADSMDAAAALWRRVDADGSGTVSFLEFKQWLIAEPEAQARVLMQSAAEANAARDAVERVERHSFAQGVSAGVSGSSDTVIGVAIKVSPMQVDYTLLILCLSSHI